MQIKRLLFFLLFCCAFLHASAASADTTLQRIERIANDRQRVDAYNKAIEACWMSGEYDRGLDYAEEALKLARKTGYRKGEAELLNNTGIIHDYLGNFAKALEAYFGALRIQEAIRDRKGIAYTCSNIGLIYSNQRNFPEALRFHKRSLAIREKLHFRPGISASHNNIGIVYMNQKKYRLALDHYFASVKIDRKLGDERGLGDSYNNIGVCYMGMNDFEEAENYFLQSIAIREKHGDRMGLCTSCNNIGTLFSKQRQWKAAKAWLRKGLQLGQQIGGKDIIKYSYQQLSEVEEQEGDFEAALAHYKLFVAYGDSLANFENTRLQAQAELQYQIDKKEALRQLAQQKKDLNDKKEREFVQLVLWSVIALAIITIVFSVFLYQRWKIARNQQRVIAEKNRLLELKNREILDSISYAKRIQSAILPPEKLVKEFLVNSFILYKPKDIVAGDFYWMETQGDTIIFAAADCTGHGVPGALISVVCHNALNRSVREFGLMEPGAILDKTREIIIEEFAKSEDDVNDGMDISLCALNTQTLHVQWSGANNPLWVVRHRSNEVTELKANKQPIGKYSRYEAFDTHQIQLQHGDSLYLFTDGFADQFGGPEAKKFKSKNMKELILRVKDQPMAEQKRLFELAFDNWKGDLEQVDDVCVLGIRV